MRRFVDPAALSATLTLAVSGLFAQERDDFIDEWVSVNPATEGITRIVIGELGGELTVNAFGSCSPTECDWGAVLMPFEEYPLVLVYRHGFATTTLTMCIAGPDHLFVASDSVFHDGTDRDYSGESFFRRRDGPPDGPVGVEEFVDTWVAVYPDPPERDGLPTFLMREAVIERDGDRLIVTASGECRPTECELEWGEAVIDASRDLQGNGFVALFSDSPAGQFTIRLVGEDFLYVDGGRRAESVLRRAGSSDICSLDREIDRDAFLRGDCDGDGRVAGQVTDAVFLLNYSFLSGPRPPCLAACDANGDGRVAGQVTDAVYLLNHSFLDGPPPVPPFPACGPGERATDAVLGCDLANEACASP